MRYDKPHLSLDAQVEVLIDRGLLVRDRALAVDSLRAVGYFRLAAYTYPLRKRLEPGDERHSSAQHRRDDFVEGASFETALALHDFDAALRQALFRCLTVFEVALRASIAHTVTISDPLVLFDESSFDRQRAFKPSDYEQTSYERWVLGAYTSLRRSNGEDFVRHYSERYDDQPPAWVVTEVLEFGSLVRPFTLLDKGVQTSVAREFGVLQGRRFESVLKQFNYTRNLCAHHSRLWNREFTYSLPKNLAAVVPALADSRGIPDNARGRLYGVVTLVMHVLDAASIGREEAVDLLATLKRFPQNDHFALERQSAFPTDWRTSYPWR